MKHLLILRHAEPEKTGPDGTDFTRPLTAGGEAQANIQGRFLREADMIPDFIAASSAVRARTTAELLRASMESGPEVSTEDSLYNASGDELLTFIHAIPESIDTALIVAHMPGVAELLNLLTTEFGEMGVVFSACTLACISLDGEPPWPALAPASGELLWLLPPIIFKG